MDKTSKKHNPKVQMIFAVMIMAALFLAELYVMINEAHNIILIVGIVVLILIALYFVIDAVFACINEKAISDREQYESIYRSEKASYMLLKKNFDLLSKQVKNLDNGSKEDNPAEIIRSQKAIAKAAMSRMNQTQDRLFIELNNLEASLNDNIRGLSEKLSGFQEEIERLADHIAHINEQAILEVSKKNTHSPIAESIVMPVEEPEKETSPEISVIADKPESSVTQEDSIEIELGNEDEADKELDLDDIYVDNLDMGNLSVEESEDDILTQLLSAEKAPVEEMPDAVEELAKAVNEEPVPIPVPADDNPNKMMTPEEIAALIAGM